MVHAPLSSGPERTSSVCQWLKLPAIATLFASGSLIENRTPFATVFGARLGAAHPYKRRGNKRYPQRNRLMYLYVILASLVCMRSGINAAPVSS